MGLKIALFKDVRFMSAKEKEKAWRNFKQIIDAREISLLKNTLYDHCHMHCSFIAHYNRQGFISEYSGQNFRSFVEHFDRNWKYNGPGYVNKIWMRDKDYSDLNQIMVDYCTVNAPLIYAELDERKRQTELALLKRMAQKHSCAKLAELAKQRIASEKAKQTSLFR